MPTSAFTRQLAAVHFIGSGAHTIFTAPGAGAVVVRDVALSASAAANSSQLFIITPGGNMPFQLIPPSTTPSTFHWDGRVRLNPGDQLAVFSDTATDWWVVATGYVFAS